MVDYVSSTIAENFGSSAFGDVGSLVKPEHQFSLEDCPSLKGKVAVITGGSQGIGYGASHTFLSKGIDKIFMLSVSQEVVDGAKKAIAEEFGQEAADKVIWHQCDLSDWKRVAEVASEITRQTDRIDILFNNASRGIMTYQIDQNGVDRHMSVSVIGHVILTSHLMPLLKKTADTGATVRIVNQASNAHQAAPKDVKFASLSELNQDLGPNGQYGRAKLGEILYSRYLARHLSQTHPNILANATHPGFVSTKMSKVDIHEPYPLAGYGMSTLMEPFKKDQFEGAVSAVYACTTIEQTGQYICCPAVPEPGSELSHNEELGEQMLKLVVQIVQDKTDAGKQGCPFKTY